MEAKGSHKQISTKFGDKSLYKREHFHLISLSSLRYEMTYGRR